MTDINASMIDTTALTTIRGRSCPSTSKMEQISNVWDRLWESDRRKSVDQTATEVGISIGSRHNILHDMFNMRCFCQHLVPRMLTPENKRNANENFWCHYRCLVKVTNSLKTYSQAMKHGVSCKWSTNTASIWIEIITNSAQKFQVDRRKERSCWKFFTANSLSIVSSSLKVKLWIKKCM